MRVEWRWSRKIPEQLARKFTGPFGHKKQPAAGRPESVKQAFYLTNWKIQKAA